MIFVFRIILAVLTLITAFYVYRDLPEYRATITIGVGIPLATLVLIVRRSHIFPIVCCTTFSLIGAALNTSVYCTHGNGLGIDTQSMIVGVVIGGGFGMFLNAVRSQRILADIHSTTCVDQLLTKAEGEP